SARRARGREGAAAAGRARIAPAGTPPVNPWELDWYDGIGTCCEIPPPPAPPPVPTPLQFCLTPGNVFQTTSLARLVTLPDESKFALTVVPPTPVTFA